MSEKVLVIHHERIVAEFLCAILLEANYDASLECTSDGAIRNAQEVPPKLIITDAVMPGKMGMEVAKEIFHATKCKVLFVSSGAGEDYFAEIVDDFRREGCDCDSVLTPIEKPQLLLQVRNQITRRILAH